MDILVFALCMLAATGPAVFLLVRYIQALDAKWQELTDDAESEK